MRTMGMLTLYGALVAGVIGVPGARAADERTVAAADERKDADDTGRNVRDRNGKTVTPMDQGSSQGNRTITQEIRKQITDNDQLSTNAKNVKIVTVDGVVTLRGPVKSPEEKTTIASIARKAAGVKRVDDQIEVERNP